MKNKVLFGIIIMSTMLLVGCAVMASFYSNTFTIVLEYGGSFESEDEITVSLPSEARDSSFDTDSIILHYEVEKSGAYNASVRLYVSSETSADGSLTGSTAISDTISLASSSTSTSGSLTNSTLSTIVQNALNNNQTFVLGVDNLTNSGDQNTNINVDLQIEVRGYVPLFF